MTVDSKYYTDVYGGERFDDIDRLLLRAEEVISCMATRTPEGEMQETCYRKAICAQAEYIGLCGGVAAWQSTMSSSGEAFTVGSFSMSGGGSASRSSAKAYGIAQNAVMFLEKGGLCYRGVAVI